MSLSRSRVVVGLGVAALFAAIGLTGLVSRSLSVSTFAAQSKASAPGAEQKPLEFLAGKWRFAGTTHDSQFGKGGKTTGTTSCEWFDGRFHLVCRGEFTEADGTKATQMEIIGYSKMERMYERFHIDSSGGSSKATATLNGKTWGWHGTATLDGKKTRFDFPVTQTSQDSYTVKVTMTPEGGKPAVLEEVTATRIK